ncbi:MAG: response regulator [Gemmatimonadetes bacterium]|nr:response regulator [Gemmatimonadota bacterium]
MHEQPSTWRVLVVDDEPAVRRVVSRHLERCGIEVVEASAADGVLAQLRSHFFDLLILDLDLSGGSAAPLLAQLCDQWADLPVLLLTGGVKDGRLPPAPPKSSVLPKPFQINQLHSRIQELLGR